MIDAAHVGRCLPVHSAAVERGRLRFFAKAIGETSAIYSDVAAARAAGYRDLPVPPTFLFCLEMEQPNPFEIYEEMGISLMQILHGEQAFSYHLPVCAGDEVTFQSRIADIYSKKGGAMEFVVKDTQVFNQHDEHVADLRSVVVVRN